MCHLRQQAYLGLEIMLDVNGSDYDRHRKC